MSLQELGITSDIQLKGNEMIGVYQDKIARLTQERDSLNMQVTLTLFLFPGLHWKLLAY